MSQTKVERRGRAKTKMLVVNFFGESCTGKSTHAMGLCSALKKAGIRAELVRESCKDYFFDKTEYKLGNQMLITGKQIEQTMMYEHGGLDVVVTDSPILLGAVYGKGEHYKAVCEDEFNHFNNFNILLERDVAFDNFGRNETQTEGTRDKILAYDLDYAFKYKTSELDDYEDIVSKVLSNLKVKQLGSAEAQKLHETLQELRSKPTTCGHFDIGWQYSADVKKIEVKCRDCGCEGVAPTQSYNAEKMQINKGMIIWSY